MDIKILAEKLIKNNVNRKSVIIAIGGGTLGDLAGFVASTLLRGLDFFNTLQHFYLK